MQSGIRRKTFNIGPAPAEVASRGFGSKKKDRPVVGLASDVLDRVVVACTLDGTLNVSCKSSGVEEICINHLRLVFRFPQHDAGACPCFLVHCRPDSLTEGQQSSRCRLRRFSGASG